MNRKDIVEVISKDYNYGVTEISCMNNEVHITSKFVIPQEVVSIIENMCKVVIYRSKKGIMAALLFYHNDIDILLIQNRQRLLRRHQCCIYEPPYT